MSSVVLISDLLYQSAGIVFLDGGRVSEELVMVSLAFHPIYLSVAQLFLLLCSYVKLSQVKNLVFIPSKENLPHIKPQRQCTYVKD